MVKNIISVVICLVVAGAMTMIMILFTKKLAKLETERWGDKAKFKQDLNGKKKAKKSKKKKKATAEENE